MELSGRRAVVTGGGGGLGEVIVRALAAYEAQVVVADVDPFAAHRVATEVGGTELIADLSTVDGVDLVAAACGKRDVLINCAGGWSPSGRNYSGREPS